jgi:ribonuclease HI
MQGTKPIACGFQYFTKPTTSNEAEYIALTNGLEYYQKFLQIKNGNNTPAEPIENKKTSELTTTTTPTTDKKTDETIKKLVLPSKTQLTIIGDSQLVIAQMLQQFKVRAPHLLPLHNKAFQLFTQVSKSSQQPIEIKPISRRHNRIADYLVNYAMDK